MFCLVLGNTFSSRQRTRDVLQLFTRVTHQRKPARTSLECTMRFPFAPRSPPPPHHRQPRHDSPRRHHGTETSSKVAEVKEARVDAARMRPTLRYDMPQIVSKGLRKVRPRHLPYTPPLSTLLAVAGDLASSLHFPTFL